MGQSSHRLDHHYISLPVHLSRPQLYEYVCMFTFEVRFIWAARWNLTKCLYLLTRYLQFVLIGALIYQSTIVVLPSQLSKSLTQPPFRSGVIESYHITDALHRVGQIHHMYLPPPSQTFGVIS